MHRALVGVVGWIVVGCVSANEPLTEETFLLRDSAGVAIATSTDSAWTSGDAWYIREEPALVIGSLEGGAPEETFGRVAGVIRLSDGSIVVADSRVRVLRVFDREGRYRLSLGGRGEGPTEFGFLDRIARIRGDSIAARDVGAFKTVIFASDGSGHRTVSGPPMFWRGRSAVYVAGWLNDGSAVATHTPQSEDFPTGTALTRADWFVLDSDGLPTAEFTGLAHAHTANYGIGAAVLTFSGRSITVADSAGFWHGLPDRPELVFRAAGRITRIVRVAKPPVEVPASVREAYRDWYAETSRKRAEAYPQDMRASVEARIDQLEFSEHFPAFQRVLLASDGSLWLEDYHRLSDLGAPTWSWSDPDAPSRWTVVAADGRWLGTVTMPKGVSLRAIGPDQIVGVRTDDFGVQYVVAHDLVRPVGS